MAELKIKIGADVAQGVKGINLFNATLNKTPAAVNATSAAVGKATQAINNVKPGANSATLALGNLGRVAQDLPFGFLGIANNLNPLLESFQRLKVETGTTKGALSALLGSLTGAGGLGLIISGISAAASFAAIGFRAWGGETSKVKEKTDELAKSLRKMQEVQDEAVAGVQGQIAQVTALANAVLDTNVAYDQRKRALEELKEINKSYFGDLSLEAAQLLTLKSRVDEYSKALVQQAIVKKFSDEIADVAKAASDAQREVDKAALKVRQADAEVKKALSRDTQSNIAGASNAGVIKSLSDATVATEALKEAEKEFDEVRTNSVKLQEQRILLTNELNKAVAEGLKLKNLDEDKEGRKGKTALEKEIERLKKQIGDLEEVKKLGGFLTKDEFLLADLKVRLSIFENIQDNTLNTDQLQRKITEIIEAANVQAKVPLSLDLTDQLPDLKNALDVAPIKSSVSEVIQLAGAVAKQTGESNKKLLEMKALASDIANVLTSQLAGAFTDVFETIISGGENAMQEFGRAIAAVVKRLIAAAVTAAIFAAIISAATGGFGAAAQGGGFLANFTSLFKKLGPGFAEGGIASGPESGYLALLHGDELIVPLKDLKNSIGSMSGVSMAPATKYAKDFNNQFNQFGGAQQVFVSGAFELRGETLWAAIEKQEGFRTRNR